MKSLRRSEGKIHRIRSFVVLNKKILSDMRSKMFMSERSYVDV